MRRLDITSFSRHPSVGAQGLRFVFISSCASLYFLTESGLTIPSVGSIIAPMRWRKFLDTFSITFQITLILLLLVLLLTSSTVPPADQLEQARAFTRQIEFDYITWTLDALALKLGRGALNASAYLPLEQRPQVVLDYLDLVSQIWSVQNAIQDLYADPSIEDPRSASTELSAQLEQLRSQRAWLQPLAEAVLEAQVSQVAARLACRWVGSLFPPCCSTARLPPPP